MIQKVVVHSLPAGKRKVSSNGREFYSNYFLPNKDKTYQAAEKAGLRYYAKVYVLGDRRPYTVEVVVYRQRKSSYGYSDDGTDKRLAKILAASIQDNLSKRPEDLNIIDDFRVF